MTNRERLNRMSNEEYARETAAFAACPVRNFVDYEAWLESSDAEYPLIGKDGTYHGATGDRECKIVGEHERGGQPYVRIILSLPGLHDFELLSVPAGKVDSV